jgi:imidazolonepropionase-like amidohydrolase
MRHSVSRICVALALFAFEAAARAPQSHNDDGDAKYVAIKCGKVILGTGEEKENVTILVKNGKVEAIGEKVELPRPCKVIDASKLVAMPGHISAHSRLSLSDYQRSGARADLKVADEFLPLPDAFDAALSAGFTTLQLVPAGANGIPGRAMVIRTADVGGGFVVTADGAVKANLLTPAQDRRMLNEVLNGAKREIEKVDKARADFDAKKKAAEEAKKKEEEAKKQAPPGTPPNAPPNPTPGQPPTPPNQPPGQPPKGEEPPKPDGGKPAEQKPPEEFQAPPVAPPLQPFVDLIQKKPGALLFVRIAGGTSYLHFVEATKDFEIAHVLFADVTPARGRPQPFFGVPGTDMHWAAKNFGEHKELVVVAPYLSYTQGAVDFVNVPEKLLEAGARVAFTPNGDAPDEFTYFRYNVNEIIKGGMKRADAVTAMTKHAAEAIGAQDRLGTIETGKDANLVLLSADPFDVQARVEQVVIEGEVAWSREKKGRS